MAENIKMQLLDLEKVRKTLAHNTAGQICDISSSSWKSAQHPSTKLCLQLLGQARHFQFHPPIPERLESLFLFSLAEKW